MGCGISNSKNTKNFDILMSKKEDEFTYKIVLLGDVFVGKTSIIKNLQEVNKEDSSSYEPTIGLAFTQKSIYLDNKKKINLQLWDTSGQEIYRDLMSVYYRDSHAAILVYDHSNKKSLEALKYWISELNERINTDDIIMKIAGNKFDLYDDLKEKIKKEDVYETFKDFQAEKFEIVNTSALDGENVYRLFKKIAEECYKKYSNNIKINE